MRHSVSVSAETCALCACDLVLIPLGVAVFELCTLLAVMMVYKCLSSSDYPRLSTHADKPLRSFRLGLHHKGRPRVLRRQQDGQLGHQRAHDGLRRRQPQRSRPKQPRLWLLPSPTSQAEQLRLLIHTNSLSSVFLSFFISSAGVILYIARAGLSRWRSVEVLSSRHYTRTLTPTYPPHHLSLST